MLFLPPSSFIPDSVVSKTLLPHKTSSVNPLFHCNKLNLSWLEKVSL